MNYNFTNRVRRVLDRARDEAVQLRHDYVGTEHILLGLIGEGEGVAAAVLMNL
ncbi:MAG: Clp protease N-terminal domain-containing protein, partial [Longimicrobiales bacterium]